MKKYIFLLICIATISWVKAQHCDSIDNHMAGHYHLEVWDAIELSDGNLLIRAYQDSLTTNNYTQEYVPYLEKYYKISRQDFTIIDSISFEAGYRGTEMLARCHHQDGEYKNLMINVIDENNQSYLNVKFFDDDLNFNEQMEVTVPISDTLVRAFCGWNWKLERIWLLDSNDDIIITYFIQSRHETHFARFGLDGTLKHDQAYTENVMPIDGGWVRAHGLTQYSTNPIGYNYFGMVGSDHWGQGYNWGYELDSLFNITNTFILNETNPPEFPYFTYNGSYDGMTSLGDGTACFARSVWRKPKLWHWGLQKVDNNGQILREVWFKLVPLQYEAGHCIGLQKDHKGYICFSHISTSMDSVNYVACIKVDENLDIIWEQYNLKDPSVCLREYERMKVLDNGAMMMFATNHHFNWNYTNPMAPGCEPWLSGMFAIVFDEGIADIPEAEIVIRPYLFYPNPVDDLLNIHYSPDVKPTRIELYDLQSRLVRTQITSFESLSMKGLAAGQYVLKVTLENGKVYTDKVVKE